MPTEMMLPLKKNNTEKCLIRLAQISKVNCLCKDLLQFFTFLWRIDFIKEIRKRATVLELFFIYNEILIKFYFLKFVR